MPETLLLNGITPGKPITFAYSADTDTSLLFAFISSKVSSPFYLNTQGGKPVSISTPLSSLFSINVNLPLLGGKGGFGSMLRATGNKMKKDDNVDSCRDLSGRRIKTIREAKALAEQLEKEPERKRKKQEKIDSIIHNYQNPKPPKEVKYDDPEFEKSHEKIIGDVKNSMAKAIAKKLDAKNGSSKAKPVKKIAVFDDSDSDSEAEEEDEEPSPKKRNKGKQPAK